MSEPALAKPVERFESLDVFRGITIAGMTLVNNPGSWSNIYTPLSHAKWHGWTPTDFVFPFFLFIVGVAITFSFDRRLARGDSRLRLFEQVVRRTVILFMLGLCLNGFFDFRLTSPFIWVIVAFSLIFYDMPLMQWPSDTRALTRKAFGVLILLAAINYFVIDFQYFQDTKLRVPGVLQRIAFCYLFASLIVMYYGVTGRVLWTLLLLVGYWLIYHYVHAPQGYAAKVASPDGLLHEWIDGKLLGVHVYGERPDPEGILSTLPAIGTTLLGVLTGNWLQSKQSSFNRMVGMAVAGGVLIVAGLYLGHYFPINKKIWTSTFVILMGGFALATLAFCFLIIDVMGFKAWSWPFMVFGTNAIAIYCASGILGRFLVKTQFPVDGKMVTLKSWIFEHLFNSCSWFSPKGASLAYAISYVLLFLILSIPLYRKRIFIKV